MTTPMTNQMKDVPEEIYQKFWNLLRACTKITSTRGYKKLTEREVLAWLHGFGEHGSEVYTTSRTDDYVCELSKGIMRGGTVFYLPHEKVNGTTLRDALMRLVVAVAEREAKA